MKTTLSVFSLVFGLALTAGADTVIVGFNDAFNGGIASNLANASGTVTDGMNWGIIVDTGHDGFASGGSSYNAYAPGVNTAGYLSVGGVVTNDYFIPGATTVDATNLGYVEGNGTIPGHGSIIDDMNQIALSNGLAAGQSFALVWFGTNTTTTGSSYGLLTDATFLLPSGGSTTEFGVPFVGNDPIRAASNTFAAIAGAPEPSRVLLFGFGAVAGLMVRRRRIVA